MLLDCSSGKPQAKIVLTTWQETLRIRNCNPTSRDSLMPSNVQIIKWLSATLYTAILLSFLAGLVLSFLSWLEVCTQECSEAHHYQLFGLSFGMMGIVYFGTLIASHLLSIRRPTFYFISGLIVAGGLGAEIMLIVVQKFVIGKWCPVCLSIAGMVSIAALCFTVLYMLDLDAVIRNNMRNKIMQKLWKGITSISVFAIGFIVTFFGIGKEDKLQAAQTALEQNLVFGNAKSPVTVFIFTDWQCPACRQAESAFEKMFITVAEKAQVVFIDLAIHPESLNFIPYNLSFILRNKPQYMQLRHLLTNISSQTDSPTDEQVSEAAAKIGVKYQQLSYSDIVLGIRYFKRIVQENNIQGTPTVLVMHLNKNVKKKISGSDSINEANVLKAIESML
jgi:thiol-disulfide isomerase/thioredoxin